jgi:hypothetical protein
MLFNKISKAHHAWILSCFGPGASIWLITKLVFLAFRLFSLGFFTTLCMRLGLHHPSIACILQCVCTHPIDPMGIHLLHCAHGNECTRPPDAICNTFAAIAWDGGFHVRWEQLHVLFSTTFNSLCQWVNIVITKDDIRTLADVIIVDPTRVNLLHRSCVTQGFVASHTTQAKEKNYHNWHLTNQYLPLAIETFGCLHKHTNVFLHNCANAIWSLKRLEALHLSTLVSFVCQKVSINYKRCKHPSSQVRQ